MILTEEIDCQTSSNPTLKYAFRDEVITQNRYDPIDIDNFLSMEKAQLLVRTFYITSIKTRMKFT